MKALNVIICLLAVTISVACSKKKDGNSNPNYGYTPNDPRYNGRYYNPGMPVMPTRPVMPGFQVPPQANCQSPTPMFSDLVSYCAWLAQDGVRVCGNPMVVRQTFLQFCQSFATRFNFCTQEVRQGCRQVGCRDRGWKRYSTWDGGSPEVDEPVTRPGGGDRPLPPTVVRPPVECTPRPDLDCKSEKKNKKDVWCRRPGTSGPYDLTKDQYMAIACEDTGSSSSSGSGSGSSASSGSSFGKSTMIIPRGRTADGHNNGPGPATTATGDGVATIARGAGAQTQTTQRNCVEGELRPDRDCRYLRAIRDGSVARGTTKRGFLHTDFEKDSNGRILFNDQVDAGNVACKVDGSRNATFAEYRQSRTTCTEEVVNSNVKQAAVQVPKVDLSQCLNVEEIHKYIVNSDNNMASHAEYFEAKLDGNYSPQLVNAWKASMQSLLNKYQTSTPLTSDGKGKGATNLSAIGAHIDQRNAQFNWTYFRNAADYGTVVACSAGQTVDVEFFQNEIGARRVHYVATGSPSDDNFELIETTYGAVQLGNERGTYKLSRYIGVGRNLSAKQVQEKVNKDMAAKGYKVINSL